MEDGVRKRLTNGQDHVLRERGVVVLEDEGDAVAHDAALIDVHRNGKVQKSSLGLDIGNGGQEKRRDADGNSQKQEDIEQRVHLSLRSQCCLMKMA